MKILTKKKKKNPHKGSDMNERELSWVLLVDVTLVKL